MLDGWWMWEWGQGQCCRSFLVTAGYRHYYAVVRTAVSSHHCLISCCWFMVVVSKWRPYLWRSTVSWLTGMIVLRGMMHLLPLYAHVFPLYYLPRFFIPLLPHKCHAANNATPFHSPRGPKSKNQPPTLHPLRIRRVNMRMYPYIPILCCVTNISSPRGPDSVLRIYDFPSRIPPSRAVLGWLVSEQSCISGLVTGANGFALKVDKVYRGRGKREEFSGGKGKMFSTPNDRKDKWKIMALEGLYHGCGGVCTWSRNTVLLTVVSCHITFSLLYTPFSPTPFLTTKSPHHRARPRHRCMLATIPPIWPYDVSRI